MTSRYQAGLVILDTNCFDQMRDPTLRKCVKAGLRAAHLQIRGTAVNVLEISNHPNAKKRAELLTTLRELSDGYLLPWPHDLLSRIGQAIIDDETRFRVSESGLEDLMEAPLEIETFFLNQVQQMLADMESVFDSMHAQARPKLQGVLKGSDYLDRWPDARSFLDDQWSKPEQLDAFIQEYWNRIGLPGEAPIDRVYANQAFRLLLEGLGVAVYERDVVKDQLKRVQISDLCTGPGLLDKWAA